MKRMIQSTYKDRPMPEDIKLEYAKIMVSSGYKLNPQLPDESVKEDILVSPKQFQTNTF